MGNGKMKVFRITGHIAGTYVEEVEARTEEEAIAEFNKFGPSYDMDFMDFSIDSVEEIEDVDE